MRLLDAITNFHAISPHKGYHHLDKLVTDMKTVKTDECHTTFAERCDFVETGLQSFFHENQLDMEALHPLSNGGTSLVMNCSDEFVLKIKRGTPYDYGMLSPDIMLHPETSGHSKELDISYEIMRKADVGLHSFRKFVAFQYKALKHSALVIDCHPANFGYLKNEITGKKDLRVIDAGAVLVLPHVNIAFR